MAINLSANVTQEEINAIAALSNDARADLAARINATDPFSIFDLVDGKTDEIICPICGSGSHGNKNTGIKPTNKNGTWLYNCFAGNDCNGDLVKVIATVNNKSTHGKDFFEVLAIAAKIWGFSIFAPSDDKPKYKKNFPAPKKNFQKKKSLIPVAEYSRLNESREKLPAFVEKQGGKWRGLTVETLQRIKAGFLEDYRHPKSKNNYSFSAVIIPNDLNGVFARNVKEKGYSNISPTATTTIFLPDSEEFDLIVTEGAINGASILQAIPAPNFGIIASGGTSGNDDVLAKCKQLTDNGKKIRVLIAYDNDLENGGKGQKAAAKLLKMLRKVSIAACCIDITQKGDIDLNDVLQSEGAVKLAEMVKSAIDAAQIELTTIPAIPTFPTNEITNNFLADDSAEYDSFEENKKSIAADKSAFEEEKAAAKEKISNLVTFENSVMFQEDILKAAAFCKLFAPADYSRLINDIRDNNSKNPKTAVNLQDFKGELKEYIAEIKQRELDLKHRETVLTATKKTADFISRDDFLSNATIPAPFAMNSNGLFKVSLAQEVQICRAPIVIRRIIKDLNSKTVKIVLAYYENNKLVEIPAVTASTIADKRNIPKLADNGLPVTSNSAAGLVEFFDAFKFANRDLIPLDYSVKNCGWLEYDGQNIFIDPRITQEKILNADDSTARNLVIDSDCYIAKHLKSKGSLDKSKAAFNKAVEQSPLAAFMCYLAVSGFLLKILNERNFVVYVYGKTRGGKSTALKLATSMTGHDKLIFSFDATAKVIPELAANYSDYCLPIDEKQVADRKLKEQFKAVIYSLANGIGRIKLNKDSTIRIPKDWTNITLANGEDPLFGDNVTGGVNTRLLPLPAPDVIIDAENCNFIREIISDNYGLAFPLVLELAKKFGNDYLRERFKNLVNQYETISKGKKLTEYCRYISVGIVGGFLLHMIMGDNEETAFEKAFKTGLEILKLAPSNEEIDVVKKQKILIQDFIAINQNHFIGGNVDTDRIQGMWGKIDDADFAYINRSIVENFCKQNEIDYSTFVKNLIADGFFVGDSKDSAIQKKIQGRNARYFRIPQKFLS